MSKAIPVSIWNNFTANMDKEALDRKSWILDGDLWFQFKVKWKYDFFEISKAIPVPVSIWKEFTSKNVAAEALDRIGSAFQFKVTWKLFVFFEMSKAIPVSIWNEFTPKTWLERH